MHVLEDETVTEGIEDDDDADMRCYYLETWKAEFCPVALDLLRRIEENQSHLEPILSWNLVVFCTLDCVAAGLGRQWPAERPQEKTTDSTAALFDF